MGATSQSRARGPSGPRGAGLRLAPARLGAGLGGIPPLCQAWPRLPTTARAAWEAAGRSAGRGRRSPSQPPCSRPPREGERAGAVSFLLSHPPAPPSRPPIPLAGSASSIFQIFLEPAALRAAVARALTEAAEAAARASPRGPSAQAQSSVTAGWRRRPAVRKPGGGGGCAATSSSPSPRCPARCPRFEA